MELTKEGCFDFPAAMIVGAKALQNLVHSLEQERPEAVEEP